MQKRKFTQAALSLAVSVSMMGCTADQLLAANGLIDKALAKAEVFLETVDANGLAQYVNSITQIDSAKIVVDGQEQTLDLSKLSFTADGGIQFDGLPQKSHSIQIKPKGSQEFVELPVEYDANGKPVVIRAQAQFGADGKVSEYRGGYDSDKDGSFDANGKQFQQSGGQFLFDRGNGRVESFRPGQFRPGQGQLVQNGQAYFQTPQVLLDVAGKKWDGKLVRAKIGEHSPPPFASRLKDGKPSFDVFAFGPALNKSKRPQVTLWVHTQGQFRKVTLALGADVQGPGMQGGQQPGGMQQGGMQQGGMQQGGMPPPPGGQQPAPRFAVLQAPPQGGMQPPPGGQQPGMQPPPGGQQGGQGMKQMADQTITCTVVSDEVTTEQEALSSPQRPPCPPMGGMQPGGQFPQGGMQPPPGGAQPPQFGTQQMAPPPGGQQQGGMMPPPGGQQQGGMQPGGMPGAPCPPPQGGMQSGGFPQGGMQPPPGGMQPPPGGQQQPAPQPV